MNHFDAVDFSECHSEEVISFFWCSLYLQFLNVNFNAGHITVVYKEGSTGTILQAFFSDRWKVQKAQT